MKNDSSIKSISIASIKRHSIDVEGWKRTTFSLSQFPEEVTPLIGELPITRFFMDQDNWTLITTQRIIGKIYSEIRETYFTELDRTIWKDFKNLRMDRVLFRTTNIQGETKEFLMEAGNPSMAIIYGIQTVSNIYKASR